MRERENALGTWKGTMATQYMRSAALQMSMPGKDGKRGRGKGSAEEGERQREEEKGG